MKIVFLHDHFPPEGYGGAAHSTYDIVEGARRAGHEVCVITTCRKKEEEGEIDYNGVRTFRIYSNYPDRWRAYLSLYNPPVVRRVRRLLQKIQPDVVHIHNIHFYLSYHCFALARRYAKAVIFTARDVMPFNYGKLVTPQYLRTLDHHTTWLDHIRQAKKRYNPFRNTLIKWYVGYADKIVAISEALRIALIQNGIDGGRAGIDVIYNGIDVREWQVEPTAVEQFRERHNLAGKKVLFFSGRLSPAKGAEKVLEAMSLIQKEVPNVALLVAGSVDWYAQIMQEQARKKGIEERLIFTGWIGRDDMKCAYAVADVVLMPSICFDSFGRVNIEAMASKKPVVGTCFGGTPEIVEDGVTGYVVNPLYPEKITEKAVDLLKNSDKAQAFGRAGYERVEKMFDLNKLVAAYLARYQNLIRR